jgi:hypothetical protein
MDLTSVEQIANAVLYEGYMLYPYRASSVKNKQRFNWGALAPPEYSAAQKGTESFEMLTQVLVSGVEPEVSLQVRFLHLTNRELGRLREPSDLVPEAFETVASLEVDGDLYQAWQEAVERSVDVPLLKASDPVTMSVFAFPDTLAVEPITDRGGKVAGLIIRTQSGVKGEIEAAMEPAASGLSKITVRIRNTTPLENAGDQSRDIALLRSFVSTHAILSVDGGEFVSLLEPPDEFAEMTAACENKGAFPILVGSAGDRTCMLASPIILYDYPEIAPESPGDLFDGTEIDEILTLRIMTMTEQEKREMRAVDDRARKILERTEQMSDDELLRMHGTLRGMERSRYASTG